LPNFRFIEAAARGQEHREPLPREAVAGIDRNGRSQRPLRGREIPVVIELHGTQRGMTRGVAGIDGQRLRRQLTREVGTLAAIDDLRYFEQP